MRLVLKIDDKYRIEQDNFNFIVVTSVEITNKKGENIVKENKRFLPTLYSALSEVIELRAADENKIDDMQQALESTFEKLRDMREEIKDIFSVVK